MKVAGRFGVKRGRGRFVMVFGFGESDAFGGWCVQDRDRSAGAAKCVLVSEVGGGDAGPVPRGWARLGEAGSHVCFCSLLTLWSFHGGLVAFPNGFYRAAA